MARHTDSHALLPGVEYHVASETLFIDMKEAPWGLKGVSLAGDTMPESMKAYMMFVHLFPSKRVRMVTIKGA